VLGRTTIRGIAGGLATSGLATGGLAATRLAATGLAIGTWQPQAHDRARTVAILGGDLAVLRVC
jgi:hypothetical protein